MDEESVGDEVPTVGDQLRAARKKKKMSLEDVAARTRIPLRHLESIEASDWAHLPAPTYTVGFAKSYAGEVDLDRTEIGHQLRAEMGDPRVAPAAPEVFEPADPARSMPKALVIGAIIAVLVLVGLMRWLNQRSLGDNGGEPEANQVAPTQAPAKAPPLATPVPQGPVVLSAIEPVWIAVYDKAGASYFSGMLNPGPDFTVPANAAAPLLKTGKPEALKILVGTAIAPPVGPAGQRASDVSLLPADLLKAGAATAPPPVSATMVPPPPTAAAPTQRRTIAPAHRPAPPTVTTPAPAPSAAEPPPANTIG